MGLHLRENKHRKRPIVVRQFALTRRNKTSSALRGFVCFYYSRRRTLWRPRTQRIPHGCRLFGWRSSVSIFPSHAVYQPLSTQTHGISPIKRRISDHVYNDDSRGCNSLLGVYNELDPTARRLFLLRYTGERMGGDHSTAYSFLASARRTVRYMESV